MKLCNSKPAVVLISALTGFGFPGSFRGELFGQTPSPSATTHSSSELIVAQRIRAGLQPLSTLSQEQVASTEIRLAIFETPSLVESSFTLLQQSDLFDLRLRPDVFRLVTLMSASDVPLSRSATEALGRLFGDSACDDILLDWLGGNRSRWYVAKEISAQLENKRRDQFMDKIAPLAIRELTGDPDKNLWILGLPPELLRKELVWKSLADYVARTHDTNNLQAVATLAPSKEKLSAALVKFNDEKAFSFEDLIRNAPPDLVTGTWKTAVLKLLAVDPRNISKLKPEIFQDAEFRSTLVEIFQRSPGTIANLQLNEAPHALRIQILGDWGKAAAANSEFLQKLLAEIDVNPLSLEKYPIDGLLHVPAIRHMLRVKVAEMLLRGKPLTPAFIKNDESAACFAALKLAPLCPDIVRLAVRGNKEIFVLNLLAPELVRANPIVFYDLIKKGVAVTPELEKPFDRATKLAAAFGIQTLDRFDTFNELAENRLALANEAEQKLLHEEGFPTAPVVDGNLIDSRPPFVVLYPNAKSDPAGAFLNRDSLHAGADHIDFLTSYYQVFYFEVSNLAEALQAIERVAVKKGIRPKNVLVGGHGSSLSTLFGADSDTVDGNLSPERQGGFGPGSSHWFSLVEGSLDPHANVYLLSCSTGGGEIKNNQGAILSRYLSGRTVIAPDDDVLSESYFVAKRDGSVQSLEYIGGNRVKFVDGNATVETGHYTALFLAQRVWREETNWYEAAKKYAFWFFVSGFLIKRAAAAVKSARNIRQRRRDEKQQPSLFG